MSTNPKAMTAETRQWLKDYFTYDWPSSRTAGLDRYYWTGFKLIEEIGEGESVLDVGCGVNPLKRHITNLHGIDITDIGSDEQVAIEYFKTEEKYDVAFALGSINFGSYDTIRDQTESMVNALKQKSRIYWRCNPAHRDHGNDKVKDVPFFHWRLEHHLLLAKRFGYEVTEFMPDKNRYYVKWERK